MSWFRLWEAAEDEPLSVWLVVLTSGEVINNAIVEMRGFPVLSAGPNPKPSEEALILRLHDGSRREISQSEVVSAEELEPPLFEGNVLNNFTGSDRY